ncbi:Uncharacterized conserved protein, DUF427 family [Meinhardsimonia xiamenensis]|jgi:uncharacterized protein (DUF427 family)|uniref:Uncharacterized conserved protein, DUF427 family n=1 Tax=Meinhardsimonia xiamenensis TaxID=990712 RepID=A0A1G9CXF8_9RHOB|nr:DUF427 domain-containing protein [Meinhardsimonia xiamenensis]PRX38217.1 uncharacterized protein (DUF427 family) [Meinhardsimonia xiamenensis]SDK56104.1 Uncharacterized conserved protein, DUF427 family [Meinhardsimonia xiamenensis]
MAERIRIRRAPGTWVVRAGGAVIGETREALELSEGELPPVIYFPREDVAMAFLERSATVTNCPWKGEAAHYALHTKSGIIEDAAWSYEAPLEPVAAIAGYLAFYPEKATVEEL